MVSKSENSYQQIDDTLLTQIMALFHQPVDPSSLAITRIFYGLLMMFDITLERGMAIIDVKWGNPDSCIFPLFDFIKPLSSDWMHMLYLSMIIASFCICIGLKYHFMTTWLAICYWYIILLDKTAWNNHTYLLGLFALFFSVTDANRWWSVDGLLDRSKCNTAIPLWQLLLFRFQIFIVYFYAGIKKFHPDWISGHSMRSLATHWIFSPFRTLLTIEQIDLHIVHHCGLAFDLFEGFLLHFNTTRPVGLILGCYFHFTNAWIFQIGIFPYIMLATLPIFCNPDWPKHFVRKLRGHRQNYLVLNRYLFLSYRFNNSLNLGDTTINDGLENQLIKNYDFTMPYCSSRRKSSLSKRNYITFLFFSLYAVLQLCLPFSHQITKGYIAWDGHGLYGYSWDMMIRTWITPYTKITVVDNATQQYYDLKPNTFIHNIPTINFRWDSHPDMMKQYAMCIARHAKKFGVKKPAVYFDIWKSLNYRFQQRLVNSNIDLVSAEWSPWKATSWIMPHLNNLTWWTSEEIDLKMNLLDKTYNSSINYIADFPGFNINKFIPVDYRANVTVLHGQIQIQLHNYKTILMKNQSCLLPSNSTHQITVISNQPAVYYYQYEDISFQNKTTVHKEHKLILKKILNDSQRSRMLIENSLFHAVHHYFYLKKRVYNRIIIKTVAALDNILHEIQSFLS
ncbi:Vitamin K-dependent gamma-carboxylase [Trichoplax sp. H2]|nr:Vitamin K-dependent gamma-carboxylase [Trichoplax sp. H2]|eukprot:RDD40460.1 Vitamin K-dependent gamma-carboxylase [Trichoplax sp. H2]